MLQILTAAILSANSAPASPPSACTILRNETHRPANTPTFTLRATRDSVLAGRYAQHRFEVLRVDSIAAKFSTIVFGQVMEVVTTEGPGIETVGKARRVVVVWWTHGPSCAQSFPLSALRIPSGEVFLAAQPRPAAEWINGLPTFDIRYQDWAYVRGSQSPKDSGMTMAEYRDYFFRLPLEGTSWNDQLAHWKRLYAWADSNPLLARKNPAWTGVCVARTSIDRTYKCGERKPAQF